MKCAESMFPNILTMLRSVLWEPTLGKIYLRGASQLPWRLVHSCELSQYLALHRLGPGQVLARFMHMWIRPVCTVTYTYKSRCFMHISIFTTLPVRFIAYTFCCQQGFVHSVIRNSKIGAECTVQKVRQLHLFAGPCLAGSCLFELSRSYLAPSGE